MLKIYDDPHSWTDKNISVTNTKNVKLLSQILS